MLHQVVSQRGFDQAIHSAETLMGQGKCMLNFHQHPFNYHCTPTGIAVNVGHGRCNLTIHAPINGTTALDRCGNSSNVYATVWANPKNMLSQNQ